VTAKSQPGRAPRIPVSRERLAADLRSLGLRRGQDLLIHCSLQRIGPVAGGAATLLDALLDAAGPDATLVIPAQTTLNSFTSRAFLDAVADFDEDERARFVAAMPGFDPARTPSQGMGAFAEYLRTRPAAVRSRHPQASFAAIGPRARACTSVHDLDCHLGDRSPLGWLYAADAAVVLLGAPFTACTAFHLAEYRLPGVPPVQEYRCFIAAEGRRVERKFTALALDDSDFAGLGAALETAPSSGLRQRRVGSALGQLVSLRTAVDFAVSWLTVHRRRLCHKKAYPAVHLGGLVLTMVSVTIGREGPEGPEARWTAIMSSLHGWPDPELRGGMLRTDELIRTRTPPAAHARRARSAAAKHGRGIQARRWT
jgi:aminoglycoside 3-N-acetyltransferase